MKIGLYGGSFDPIHFGHLNLAFELMEKCHLEEVWFVPAQISPHKTHLSPVSHAHRLAMLELALQDIPKFQVKGLEGERPPPSYTLHTLQTLIAEEALKPSPYQFFLLMGEDSVPGFFHWYQPEEIVKLVPLLIGSRAGHWQYIEHPSYSLVVREAIQKGFVETRLLDISSSDLRERLKKNLYCGHLIPAPALKYIQENRLYQI